MATKKAKKSAKKAPRERILGIAVASTTNGRILSELIDGKFHTLESLSECRVKETDSVGWRLTQLRERGKHADRPFKIEGEDDKVRLVFLAGKSKNGHSSKSTAPAKKSKSAGAHASSKVSRAAVHDVPVSD